MAINFPSNPSQEDTFPADNGTIYVFDGEKWVSAVPDPNYADIQGATGVPGPLGATGPTGATGPKGDKGDKGDQGDPATDATTLDGLDSTQFVRSDANDALSGTLTFNSASLSRFAFGGLVFNDNRYAYFGSGAGNDARLGSNGSNLFLDLGSGVSSWYIRDGSTIRFEFTKAGNLEVASSYGIGNDGYRFTGGASKHVLQRDVGANSQVAHFYGGVGEMRVQGDGDVQNTNNNYGSISDIKLKENIVDANSQWEDIKAIQFRNYNFKEETGFSTHTQLGVIAQELEQISPGLIKETQDEDVASGEEYTGPTTKTVNYSVLYLKAVVALQEAIERIEDLEARLDQANIPPT